MFSVGKKEYHFQEESFNDSLKELISLMMRNHEETGIYNDMPFRPDLRRFIFLEDEGNLKFMSIRLEGEIIGYSVFFIDDEILQTGIRSATQSATFVDKEHRGIGIAFIKFCDDILKKQGLNSVWRQASEKLDVGSVYERLGYTLIEKSYLRRL